MLRKGNEKIEEKKDCFAYPQEGEEGCFCLKDMFCKKENCKFYKPNTEITREEIEKSLKVTAIK